MTVSLGAFNFYNPSHGTLKEYPWDLPISTQAYFGIIGELNLIGRVQGRDMELDIMLFNAVNEAVLRTGTNGIGAKQGLYGTLVINGLSWPQVIFIGFMPSEAPFYDGSGQLGWCLRGTLRFRQVAF